MNSAGPSPSALRAATSPDGRGFMDAAHEMGGLANPGHVRHHIDTSIGGAGMTR
jgi:hypothetical protein